MKRTPWRMGVVALAVSGALALPLSTAYATGETTGSVAGVVMVDGNAASGATATVKNTETGQTREIQVDAKGMFRVPQLPTGSYEVTITRDGTVVGKQKVEVRLGSTATANFDLGSRQGAEVIEVVAARPSAIDVSTTDSGLVLDEGQIDRLPVGRNLTAVTLLAPGVIEGDRAFGVLPSFGGATVGENVYYINGLNITNFRNGLGGTTVPFEFYKEFQIKTGGYSAEYGRSTGGVVNAVSKSGTNTWTYGANAFWSPDSLRDQNRDDYWYDCSASPCERRPLALRQKDAVDSFNMNFEVGGPLIEDKLFMYALYNPRKVETLDYASGSKSNSESDDAFWGVKFDFLITDDHSLELTAFSDKRDFSNKIQSNDIVLDPTDIGYSSTYERPVVRYNDELGGQNTILKYTGHITDDLTISALYGVQKADALTTGPGVSYAAVTDRITGGALGGPWPVVLVENYEDEREAARFDVDWMVNDEHTLKFGIDQETMTSDTLNYYSGGLSDRNLDTSPYQYGGWFRLQNYLTGDNRVRFRRYENIGTFETESKSFYIQDAWQITSNILLDLGLRNETFTNSGAAGEFINVDNQWAPRLGMSWDINGDGKSKLYASLGRYYLPVATNTNIRLAGGEYFTQQMFRCVTADTDGDAGTPDRCTFGADGRPVLQDLNGDGEITGADAYSTSVFGNGEAHSSESIVDQDIEPMYQDELIVGYSWEVAERWTANVRFTRRDLKQTLEDMAVDAALNQYYCENISTDPACDPADSPYATGFDFYVLGNPGEDISMRVDWDGDGALDEEFTLTADQLGYPRSERYYNALNFELDRAWDGVWSMNFSYTWSQSYGNNEGFVRSDNGQDDAGLTTLFDQPGLTDGTYGYLPNDRRHQFKLWGSYALTENLLLGYNARMQSGRPVSAFGVHPTDEYAQAYGAESLYRAGILCNRGCAGNTPWTFNLDVSLQYNMDIGGADAYVRADVFNILEADGVTEVYERAEDDVGEVDYRYLMPTAYQDPREVRLSAGFTF